MGGETVIQLLFVLVWDIGGSIVMCTTVYRMDTYRRDLGKQNIIEQNLYEIQQLIDGHHITPSWKARGTYCKRMLSCARKGSNFIM